MAKGQKGIWVKGLKGKREKEQGQIWNVDHRGKLGKVLLSEIRRNWNSSHVWGMCNRCYQLKGQDRTGLDWIGFTIGYWCCHCSKDCPMAPLSLTRPCASRSVVVLSKENPLQGYQWCETLNSNLIEKHCQRHNGPEGWVHLAKVTSWGHITSSITNLDQFSSSESRLSIN